MARTTNVEDRVAVVVKGEAARLLKQLSETEERDRSRMAAYCIRQYAQRSGTRLETSERDTKP